MDEKTHMAYLRFIWYRVRKADGTETVHRWAENASQIEGRLTLEQYHNQERLTLVAGPFKTRKEALK